jgi:putative endopeptidase
LDAYAGVLPAAFGEAQFEFRGRALAGLDEAPPRWKRAVGATEGNVQPGDDLYVAPEDRVKIW